MIPLPKYNIGDRFSFPVKGSVEGISVTVQRPVIVTGVWANTQTAHIEYRYRLHGDLTISKGTLEPCYDNKTEADLNAMTRLEPVVEAIHNARNNHAASHSNP